MLEFDPVEHKYTVDGNTLISVTTLLKSVGIIDDRWYKPSGTNRGTRVHKVTEEYDKGELDIFGIEDDVFPYIQAWIDFKKTYKPEFTAIEKAMYHPLYGYAGTVDRVAKIAGETWILDLKSGTKEKWHNLQLILYGMIYEHEFNVRPRLGCVYLTKKFKHTLIEYDYSAEPVVMAAIRINKWRKDGK